MLKPNEVLDHYFLDARHQLIEIGALLDRYDEAVAREGESPDADARLALIRESIALLVESSPEPDRAERLLMLFSEPKE